MEAVGGQKRSEKGQLQERSDKAEFQFWDLFNMLV